MQQQKMAYFGQQFYNPFTEWTRNLYQMMKKTCKNQKASDRTPLTLSSKDYTDKKPANFPPCHQKESLSSKKSLHKRNKLYKVLKILLPHVGLNILLMTYMTGGAFILMSIEGDYDMQKRLEKLQNVTLIHELIMMEIDAHCRQNSKIISLHRTVTSNWTDKSFVDENLKELDFVEKRKTTDSREKIRKIIHRLSSVHEYDDRFSDEDQMWTMEPTRVRRRWTFQAAFLYSLTLLCTTGYDHVSPVTATGRIFAVGFGLLGIPLMFLAAADIGKFLSEMVIKLYSKLLICADYFDKRIKARRSSSNGGLLDKEDLSKPSSLGHDEFLFDVKRPTAETRLELPIMAYFGLVLGYCAIGGLLFDSFEKGTVWNFMHGFFFSFNTITTIGLGNIMVNNNFYLVLIVVYCIVGLAVITMCVDLASAHLKVLFTKLHYFGRKIRGAHNIFLMAMSDDIKEALRLLAALKKSRPSSKGRITLEDIKTFLESELQQQNPNKPFVPAFIDYMKYVDDHEKSSGCSPHVSSRLACTAGKKLLTPVPFTDQHFMNSSDNYI